ncbi:hypothetical protein ACFLWH_02615, partial [Chloroflexota bacterium]
KFTSQEKRSRLPTIRTIQRIVKEVAIPDTSGTWSVADSEGEDARLVLDILAFLISSAIGILKGNFSITKREAQWIIRIRKAAPDAPDLIVWALIELYIRRETNGITDNADLDGYLALTPWRDNDCFRLYKRLVAKGKIPKLPLWYLMTDVEADIAGHFDPRFTGSEDDIREFKKDICERSKNGVSPEDIADIYNVHRYDVTDIIRKNERE